MKKFLMALYSLTSIITILSAQSIDDKFIGFYFPVDFIISLENTRNYAISEKIIYDNGYYHPFLIIDKNKIVLAGDGPGQEGGPWPVFEELLEYYQFEYTDGMAIIIDDDGNQYRKISDIAYDGENMNIVEDHIGNFVGKIILHDLIKNKVITIENRIITIPSLNDEKFTIKTLYYIYYRTDANLILTRDVGRTHGGYYLEIKNNEYMKMPGVDL